MANWSDKPTAFVILWITMRDFHQLTTNYVNTEELKMSELTFYNSIEGAEQREIAAKMLAAQLDKTFTKTYLCTYENGVTKSQAISDMVGILTSSDDTMLTLGEKVDSSYKFITES